MKKYFLIKGFHRKTGATFIPNPGLFETEKEAHIFVKRFEDDWLVYFYEPVYVGKMETAAEKES